MTTVYKLTSLLGKLLPLVDECLLCKFWLYTLYIHVCSNWEKSLLLTEVNSECSTAVLYAFYIVIVLYSN